MQEKGKLSTKRVDRRHFLGAAAIGAAGIGLAACSSEDEASAQETVVPTVAIPKISGDLAEARDAVLPAVPDSRTADLVLEAIDVTYDVAAGVPFKSWTLGGTVPSPVLHFRQGDTVNFQLVNNGTAPHSIDFHAAQIDWEVNYRSIPVGESLEFQWTADVPGAFMYHCGTPPVLHHIGNGMYGAVIVEPENGFPQAADSEFWLVQSEFYLQPTSDGMWTSSMDKMKAVTPDFHGMERHGIPVSRAPAPSQGWGAGPVPRRQLRPHALVSLPHHRCADGRRLCGRPSSESYGRPANDD